MAEDLRIALAETKTEILQRVQEAREYSVEQAEKKRNQAIGALGFAALVLALAGWLLIDQPVEGKLEDIGKEKILERAEAAAKQAEAETRAAQRLVRKIENLKETYAVELSELTEAVAAVEALGRSLDSSDLRSERVWEGGA